MRRWKETQPGGQGLLIDFESYYKSLSDTDKEVRLFLLGSPHTWLTYKTALGIQGGNEGHTNRGGESSPL